MNIQPGRNRPSLENPGICPFLGLVDDERTALSFPSDWNTCHQCQPVEAIKLEHQRDYCLSPNFKTCKVYLGPSHNRLPRDLRNRHALHARAGKPIWMTVLLLFLFAILVGLGFVFVDQNLALPLSRFIVSGVKLVPNRPLSSASATTSPLLIASPEVKRSPTVAIETSGVISIPIPTLVTATPVSTLASAIQPTPTITRIPQDIETLIGIKYLFKIHRVRQGENLDLLARLNGTTIAAISAVNYKFSTPLWVQQIIIIPVNRTDVSDLPPFEPYHVTIEVSLETLAKDLHADPTLIQFYNGLGTSDQLQEGEWIIVPRNSTGVE